MNYIIMFFVALPLFIIVCQISRILFKRVKRFNRKHAFIKVKKPLNKSISWTQRVYRANRFIKKYPFSAFSWAMFIFSLAACDYFLEFINFIKKYSILKYAILIWILYYFQSGSKYIRKESKEINRISATIFLTLLTFLAISPMSLNFLSIISNNVDFPLVVIGILFCFLPLYYITLSLLDILENPLLRILIGYVYSILIAVYTALAIGIYNLNIGEATGDLSTYTGVVEMIIKGITYMSQSSLKDIVIPNGTINVNRIIQILIGGYGTLVFASINKIASSPKEKSEVNQEQAK